MTGAYRAGWLPPWIELEHAPPGWCYLELDEPPDPAEPAIPAPAAGDVPVFTLDMVEPVQLADIRPGPIDWAGIRAHALRVGFPIAGRPAHPPSPPKPIPERNLTCRFADMSSPC